MGGERGGIPEPCGENSEQPVDTVASFDIVPLDWDEQERALGFC
ncbi:hypothetical protein [Sphingosinicella sp.]|nr:hypothetical protein [Sphingosinicella sp.]